MTVKVNYSDEYGYSLAISHGSVITIYPVDWSQLNELGTSMAEAMNRGGKRYGTPEQIWVGDNR